MRTPNEAMTTATTNNQIFQKLNHRMDNSLLISNPSKEFTIANCLKSVKAFHTVRLSFRQSLHNFTSLRFLDLCCHQIPSSPWLVKTKHRLTTFQPTTGVVQAHSAAPWAQPHTHASLFRALARTALHPSIEETRCAVLREVEGPCPPRANRQTYCPSQRHRSSQTSSAARPLTSLR